MTTCAKNHPLNFTLDGTGYMGGVYSCDRCHKTSPCASGRWACLPCKYDVCLNCLPPGTALRCKMNHSLQLTQALTCQMCKTHIATPPCWTCPMCSFDVCPRCMGLHQCQKMHPLSWTTNASGYMAGKFSCDICHKTTDAVLGRFSCLACKYDLCHACRPPKAACCNMSHPLVGTMSPPGLDKGLYICDKCGKQLPPTAGAYSCMSCMYNCCPQCMSA